MTAAGDWVVSLATGSLATTIAIIAVAALGLAMLRGRVPRQRGIAILLGCPVVASAKMIAAGLLGLLDSSPARTAIAQTTATEAGPIRPDPEMPNDFDPYAGAAPAPVRGPEDPQ
jgi:ABC-type spermidine/putrescine transport system permease subunit II